MHKDHYPRLFLPCFILILLLSLAGCRKAEKPTLSPQELAVQQTKVIYQQQTRQAAVELTRCSQVGNCDPLSTQSPGSPVATVIDPLGTTPGISPTPTYTVPATTAVITPTLPVTTSGIIPSATNTVQSVSSTATPQTPTAPSYPVATDPLTAPTNTPTRTATRTLTPTQTATPKVGWSGQWMVFLQQSNGTYISGMIELEVNGVNLTGMGSFNGVVYVFQGYAIDLEHAEGSWTSPTAGGYFRWQMIASGQFAGSNENAYGFCGTRPGGNQPEPCVILPLS